jgi:gamma-glutamyl phosphate reductase
LEATLPAKYKQSVELLNLRKIQDQMAKQKNYQQAHQVQVRAQELEEKEREQYMVDVHKKILASEANMMAKQANEMAALKKKLEAKMNERLKMREVEHNKILQRYQNVKKEIEN